MNAWIALVRREYLEHRGAFLYAPAIILLLMAVATFGALGLDRMKVPAIGAGTGGRLFELSFLVMGALWFVYLMAALFFYYADAFNADRRNNSLLFWKSMPVSDLKILSSKMLAGLTIFPALIFAAMLIGGVIVYGLAIGAAMQVPGMSLPGFDILIASSWNVMVFVVVSVLLALLWYAPFFAWVGALSTMVGRWSIPLAFLVPGIIGLFENVLLDGGPRGGYVLSYLRERAQFGLGEDVIENEVFRRARFNGPDRIGDLIASIDWTQMAGGLVVAALLVYIASEYRRRMVAA